MTVPLSFELKIKYPPTKTTFSSRFRKLLSFLNLFILTTEVSPSTSHTICDALHDFISFIQFKKHEKYPWWNVTISKVSGFTKSSTPPCVFLTFLKLCKWYYIAQSITCLNGRRQDFIIQYNQYLKKMLYPLIKMLRV